MKNQIMTETATLFSADGYRQEEGITIEGQGEIIAIGSTPHNRSDLEISEGRIESLVAGWYLTW